MSRVIKRKWIMVIVALLVALGLVYVYDPFEPDYIKWPFDFESWPTGPAGFPDTGVFTIDPGTILASLDAGNVDVFLPESISLDDLDWTGPVLYKQPIPWRQSDYLKTASALNQFVWKDTLDDWSLFDMSFHTTCQEDPYGLTGGDFRYFKTIFDKGKIKYTWRTMFMIPEYLNVVWGGGAVYPHPPLGWKKIDLSRLKVTAEDAIRIAEENGGREARLKVQNECNIVLLLMPQRFEGWKVNIGSDFEIQIDPYTGKIIK